jgi:hypothetical protein
MLTYKRGTAHPIPHERALYSTVNDWQGGMPEEGQFCLYVSPSGIKKRMLIRKVTDKQLWLHSLFGGCWATYEELEQCD